MVPTLINKDVFEPSYNDLKFMVWNRNYVCTNLIKHRNLKEHDNLQKQTAPFSWNVGYAWENNSSQEGGLMPFHEVPVCTAEDSSHFPLQS